MDGARLLRLSHALYRVEILSSVSLVLVDDVVVVVVIIECET